MSNITTATNANLTPLTNERKPAPTLDTPENLEGIDRAGWFDENPAARSFDATIGSIDNFNPDKVVSSSVVSEIFSGSDQWVSIKPLDIANKTASAVSKTANLVGKVTAAGVDAGADLFNQIVGIEPKTETPKDSKKQEEKIKKEAEYIQNRQHGDNIEMQILSIHHKLEYMAQMEEKRLSTAELAGLQKSFKDVISESGEIRADLQPTIEQKAEEIKQKKEDQVRASLASPAKHGAKGPGMSMDDNKSSETHSTAQTATG